MKMNMFSDFSEYSALRKEQREQLEKQGCTAESWDSVTVTKDFDAAYVSGVQFFGEVHLGRLGREIQLPDGRKRRSSIHGVSLEQVSIGADVYISSPGASISRYAIGDRAVIKHVREIRTPAESSFGNGVILAVVNEKGGRDVPISCSLNAHTAYMFAMYRHDSELIERLEELAAREVRNHASDMGIIDHDVCIRNAGIIDSVNIGPYTDIEGTSLLKNGTVLSSEVMPVSISSNVFAEDFIIQEGVSLGYGVSLKRAFLGQGVKVDTQFSAIDSLAFAGSELAHGEIASVFAGPFSVSHHKGTLLIACILSFFNAGSGTNQSNHMYKLGPTSQGVLERGCKTASNVYLRWPKRIGAGTIVIGSHIVAFDTHNFPFSYLVEMDEKSVLIPGRNITSIGIVRDTSKWLQRDPRKGGNLRDFINFSLYNPLSIQAMFTGQQQLESIHLHKDITQYPFTGFYLRKNDIQRGIELYELMLRAYLGRVMVVRLREICRKAPYADKAADAETVRKGLLPDSKYEASDDWADLSGLLLPANKLDELIEDIRRGRYSSLDELHSAMKKLFDDYDQYEYNWVIGHIERKKHKRTSSFTIDDVTGILRYWIDAENKLYELRREDACKEYSELAKVSYGIDGDDTVRDNDFAAIHGTFDDNKAIILLDADIQEKRKMYDELTAVLEKAGCGIRAERVE